MPTYGYRCEKCDHNFEIFQNVNDAPISACLKCGGKTTKIFYPVGIIFKGSGFHINDYCRPDNTGNDKEEPAAQKKEKSTETKKESPNKKKATGAEKQEKTA